MTKRQALELVRTQPKVYALRKFELYFCANKKLAEWDYVINLETYKTVWQSRIRRVKENVA